MVRGVQWMVYPLPLEASHPSHVVESGNCVMVLVAQNGHPHTQCVTKVAQRSASAEQWTVEGERSVQQ